MHFTRLFCSKKAFALSLAFFCAALGFSITAYASTTVTFGDNTGDDYPGTVEDAVIASDLGRYEHYIRAYFDDYNVPFFVDRRRPLSHHRRRRP